MIQQASEGGGVTMMDTMMDQTVTIPFDDDDSPPPEHREGWLLVRVHVPELNVSKCLQFPTERVVWDVKQQVLASLPKVRRNSYLHVCLFVAGGVVRVIVLSV